MDDIRKIDPNISYDVVELPSMGISYENGNKSLRVAHLTASDENILSSQNLIKSNRIVEELLRRKILDKNFDVDDLVEEDKQVVLIFLRNTAFGSDYKLSTIDPKTDKEFEFEVDLSELSFKEFKLTPDTNNEFPFHMEKSNKNITFRFLTKKQENELEEIEKSWGEDGVAPIVTKQLEMMIKSVDGNKDPMNIRNFIQVLPIVDSQKFRKFVSENKPGLDLTRTVTTPSGDTIQTSIGFGVEFFRPFFGI